jgi:hypothetical protein
MDFWHNILEYLSAVNGGKIKISPHITPGIALRRDKPASGFRKTLCIGLLKFWV